MSRMLFPVCTGKGGDGEAASDQERPGSEQREAGVGAGGDQAQTSHRSDQSHPRRSGQQDLEGLGGDEVSRCSFPGLNIIQAGV